MKNNLTGEAGVQKNHRRQCISNRQTGNILTLPIDFSGQKNGVLPSSLKIQISG